MSIIPKEDRFDIEFEQTLVMGQTHHPTVYVIVDKLTNYKYLAVRYAQGIGVTPLLGIDGKQEKKLN